jgi:hypothetical protein
MKLITSCKAALVAAALVLGTVHSAGATSFPVFFGNLNASATVATPLGGGDTLIMDTVVTTETGALSQSITFTLDSSVASVEGFAAWEVTSSSSLGPRLVGVNIDIFDSGNNLIITDTFAGVLASFAHSTITSAIGPGTYTVVVTGTGERDSVFDLSLTFAAVPEPATAGLLLAGLGLLSFSRRGTRAAA